MGSDLRDLELAFAGASGRFAALRERITSELAFAAELCEIDSDRAPDWRARLERATATVQKAAPSGSATELDKAVREAESELALLGPTAKEHTIYCVGHAHIDMNWMWSWPETVGITNDTFMTVLRLMDEFPGFVFSQSQASVYAIVERHHPELLASIRKLVKQGRWEVTASHWVENDKNIASAESLCRHLLYTRRYMQELFDLAPEDVPIDWSPDTFGHAHTVPTYLARGGIKYYYHHRPGAHGGQKRHQAFWWRGPDGSRVLARNDMALGYNGKIAPEMAWKSLLSFREETGLPFVMFVYGVGDHGGGPTRRDLRRAVDMATWPIFPTVTFARAQTFYERLEREGKNLPVLDCELNFEFTGCYTTQTLIKKSNRYAEKLLQNAETAAALAWVASGHAYPQSLLEEGWRDTLFGHFHDILPGSGVMDTRTYTHGLYQKTVAMTSVEETKALRRLAALADTSAAHSPDAGLPAAAEPESLGAGVGRGTENGGMSQAEYRSGTDHRALFLFNPLPVDRREVVEASVWDAGAGWEERRPEDIRLLVTSPDGGTVTAQVLERGAYWGHRFLRVAFPASLPGLGYGVYVVREGEIADGVTPGPSARQTGELHPCAYAACERGPEGLENDLLRVELDPGTGGIRTLTDKRSGCAVVSVAGQAPPLLRYALERSRSMSAWEIEHAGSEEAPELLELLRAAPEPRIARSRRLPLPNPGSFVARIVARYRIRSSELSLTYELRDGDPCLYLHVAGTWFERGGKGIGTPSLRLSVPLALEQPQASYEIPFGAIERSTPHGEEVPALRWACVQGRAGGKAAGCLLANDSKHGHTFAGGALSVTLIRSSFEPDPLPEIGKHEVHLALMPFGGRISVRDAVERARRLDHEVRVVSTDAHDGALPPSAQFASFTAKSTVFSALKKCEAEDALVLRFCNTGDRAEEAVVRFDPALTGPVRDAVEIDLMERPLERSGARRKGNDVSIRVPGRGIASVLVRLEPRKAQPPIKA